MAAKRKKRRAVAKRRSVATPERESDALFAGYVPERRTIRIKWRAVAGLGLAIGLAALAARRI